eukprot:gene12534-20604_t
MAGHQPWIKSKPSGGCEPGNISADPEYSLARLAASNGVEANFGHRVVYHGN